MSQIKKIISNSKTFGFVDSARGWEDAVRITVPSGKGDMLKERYIDGIIDNAHERLSPYFVVVPQISPFSMPA